MKHRLKPIVIALGFSGLISSHAFADENGKMILALQQKVASLQQQVNSLKGNETSPQSSKKQTKKTTTKKQTVSAKTKLSKSGSVVVLTPADIAAEKANNAPATPGIYDPNNLPSTGLSYLPVDMDVPGQSFVSTGPYLGVPLSYSGSNLIINTPSINEDVSLLKMRQSIDKRLMELGVQHPEDHSHLLLSGNLEAQALYRSPGNGSSYSDIDVTNTELDAYVLGPSSWTSGLLAFNYENDIGSSFGSINSNYRPFNSRVFINKAFITVGDFSKTPFYGTIGQMYVPFGTYSSNMVTNPMTKSLFRTKARAILVGFQQQVPANAFYMSAYVFRGDSHVGATPSVNNGGFNAGIKYKINTISGDVGAGVIRNVADSGGMQVTGASPFFGGFGDSLTNCGPLGTAPCGSEQIVHNVPGYDVRGTLSIGSWDLLAEYVTASTSFNPNDMTYNANGAKPQAFNTEAAYTFMTFGNKPTSIAFGYGFTKEALAIGLPQTRYSVVLNTSWWRNTLESLEFRHDIGYRASAVASGSTVAAAPGSGTANNVVTAQFDIYF